MPTNNIKKSVPIELGGKTRNLRFTFNALVALEDDLGISISDIGELLSGSVRLKSLRSLIWAGLLHEDKELTPDGIGEWLDFSMLAMVAEKLRDAFEAAFAEKEKK